MHALVWIPYIRVTVTTTPWLLYVPNQNSLLYELYIWIGVMQKNEVYKQKNDICCIHMRYRIDMIRNDF